MNDVTVIVLAAGSARRFGKAKQFSEIAEGVSLVDLAVESAFGVCPNVILVLPNGVRWGGSPEPILVIGGQTRLDSVAAGLASLDSDQQVVVVHDAAHPLAPRKTFIDVIEGVRSGADAAVPFLPVPDVVKRADSAGYLSTVGRDGMGLAQVPMAFATKALVEAHASRSGSPEAWEDSMLVEANGGRVVGVPGSISNIHVVTTEDLEMARKLFSEEL